MKDLPHVTWLRAFAAAARHSSFATAAEELGLTSAAVSQQIRHLEKHLDTQLFHRLPRGVQLTENGVAYSQVVRKSFEDMAVATSGLFGKGRKRLVRVRASISFAALVIAPRLSEFKAQHPDIQVQMTTSVWANRFDDEALDVDIRYGQGNWSDGHVVHLGHEFAIPVCRADYAVRFGAEPTLEDLTTSDVVQIIGSETDWSRLAELHELDLVPGPDWFKVDSSMIALQVVAAERGLTMVLESFARPFLEQGRLVAPTTLRLPKRRAHYMVLPDRATHTEEVRQFCTWVQTLA